MKFKFEKIVCLTFGIVCTLLIVSGAQAATLKISSKGEQLAFERALSI
jgi:hypothetical protein